MVTASPAREMPTLGTCPSPTSRNSAKEKTKVAVNEASTTFCRRSRYQRRMNLGDRVPVAICTTRTPMVTTSPISPIIAPDTVDSTLVAVEAE